MRQKIVKLIGLVLLVISMVLFFTNNQGSQLETVVYNQVIEEKINNEASYFAILEIPTINLKRELYALNDINNDVDKNLFVHPSSVFPKNSLSNVIIAGHSGTGATAYFANLHQVKLNDKLYLYYENQKYIYQIKEIEYQKKTGTLYLKTDYSQMMTLITCTYKNEKMQTIYYAKLQNILKIV